jgi:hypothetical protein
MNEFTKAILEKIANLETNKIVCEIKLEKLNRLIAQKEKESEKFFIQEITHLGGLGGGTPKEDVIEYGLAYFHDDLYRSNPWKCYTFYKNSTVESIYESLKAQCDII